MSVFDTPAVKAAKNYYAQFVAEYNQLRNDVPNVNIQFNNLLNTYRNYVAFNTALSLSVASVHLSDDVFNKTIEANSAPIAEEKRPQGISDALYQMLINSGGGAYILSAIYNFENIGKDKGMIGVLVGIVDIATGLDDILYGLAIGGLGVIPGTDRIPSFVKNVLAIPFAVIFGAAAVALNIVIDVFLAPLVIEKYNNACNQLQGPINQLRNIEADLHRSMEEINNEILKQRALFVKLAVALNKIHPQQYLQLVNSSLAEGVMFHFMAKAAFDFTILAKIRSSWNNKRKINPGLTITDFKADEIAKLPRVDFDDNEIGQLIDVVCAPH